jgi:hypothetical protein
MTPLAVEITVVAAVPYSSNGLTESPYRLTKLSLSLKFRLRSKNS